MPPIHRSSLEGLLAWRCGYATGLRVALTMLAECTDPKGRIRREVKSATVEAREAWRESGRPRFRPD